MDELAMFHAHAAKLRSSALGQQVGCAITDEDGELVSTGTNESPKAGGGQYWTGDEPDGRAFVRGKETKDVYNEELLYELIDKLRSAGWLESSKADRDVESLLAEATQPGGAADKIRLFDVMEFTREVHAEMAALMTAARRGVSVRRLSMFATTFPCHECARLIVAAGIERVVYRHPYPKSRVEEMYPDSITVDRAEGVNKVSFEPFVGIAPRLFPRVFDVGKRKDPATGRIHEWEAMKAWPNLEEYEEDAGSLTRRREQQAVEELKQALTSLDEYLAS
jgi:cytidine deaminase